MHVAFDDLDGQALDWAAAYTLSLSLTEGRVILARDLANTAIRNGAAFSSRPGDAEHLIRRGQIQVSEEAPGSFLAQCRPYAWDPTRVVKARGSKAVVAALRCYVRAGFPGSDGIDVPTELVSEIQSPGM